MFSTADTIVAIATPPGRGGIGVVRLSGLEAHRIARQLITHEGPLEPRRATLTHAIERQTRVGETAGAVVDEIIACYFPSPASYTGEDVVELSAHGSPIVLRTIVTSAIACGARLAAPGEFTLRAFLNGRMDLAQAEAVADLIDAATPLQARAAFDQLQGTLTHAIGELDARLFELVARLEASVDFPEEGYHFVEIGELVRALEALDAQTTRVLAHARQGRLLREGLQIAIVGKPNVGKSSVFNALVGSARAIVTSTPGTTRDLVTETIDLDGLRVTLVDTAGLRPTDDAIEVEGVARAIKAQAVSELILVVLDQSGPLDRADADIISQVIVNKRVIVSNKTDLPAQWSVDALASHGIASGQVVELSAATGAGLEELRRRIVSALDVDLLNDSPVLTNVRHIALVERAHEALGRARAAAAGGGQASSEEFVLADLQEARAALEEISGRRTSDEVLAHIFSRFCVGK